MNNHKSFGGRIMCLLIIIAFMPMANTSAQETKPANSSIKSITADELKGHIYFLASDFMAGRVGPSAEYEIAAQYVGAQFAAAGLEPVIKGEAGNLSYFQGVPFTKTKYGETLSWSIEKDGVSMPLVHKEDFKILFASTVNHKKSEVVYVGYGIEEPDHNWNDFENLETRDKIMVCFGGAPLKDGKPVLPMEVHEKYIGMRGFQSKIGSLFSKGAAAIILVDIDGSAGLPFPMIPSQFDTEKYIYKGGENEEDTGGMSSIYLAKPEIFKLLMGGNKNNPLDNVNNILKNYKPQVLNETFLSSEVEIVSEEMITTKNIVGMVRGTDPVLQNEYIVVGAHLDHVKPVMGQVCNGADDNASGSAGVIEIAEAVAMNPCRRSVVFIAYTAEEMGLHGSQFFISSNVLPKENLKFNLNMDMIGRSSTENEESRAHYVVTDKKYLERLEEFILETNKSVTDFPLIFDNDEDSPGGSDHQSFINEGIPAFFFFSGIHKDLHQPGDDADKIDYRKAESISKLGFLIATRLANMDAVPSFTEE